jgi:hypothetical protein
LQPTQRLAQPNNLLPAIIADYKDTYKAVDDLDTYLGHIKYPFKVKSFHLLMLLGFVRLGLVSAYSHFLELTWDKNEQQHSQLNIKQFVAALYDEL